MMEVLQKLGLAKSRKLHQCCAELDLWAGREHVALDDARAVAAIVGYLAPRPWALGVPSPAPPWPRPPMDALLKTRAATHEAEPIAQIGRVFRLPRDLGVAEAAATTYLGLLDQVVEDGRVTNNDRIEIRTNFTSLSPVPRLAD
jgi:hypothetical protein